MTERDTDDAAEHPLRRSVDSYLRELDLRWEECGLPLHYRPLEGALSYVRVMVRSVQGGTKEKPIGQPWFDAIHFEALRWYVLRYGDAMHVDSGGSARGIALLGGAPVSLAIPLTVHRPGSEPLTTRLFFPDSLRDDEDPFAFIEGRIDVGAFPPDAQNRFRESIADIVRRTRELNRGFRFADLPEPAVALVDRVMWSLDKAVVAICANASARLNEAVSELNFVGELSLKVFLMQRAADFDHIHVVRDLYKSAIAAGLQPLPSNTISIFPKKPKISKHRYGQAAPPTLKGVLALYDAALTLGVHCGSQCPHGLWVTADGWIEVGQVGSLGRAK